MVILCENFTLSEVEMPHLRHLRAFKTLSSIFNSPFSINLHHLPRNHAFFRFYSDEIDAGREMGNVHFDFRLSDFRCAICGLRL